MIEERLTDAERRRIIQSLIDAMPRTGRDRQLTAIIKKLSGTDTVVNVYRAYPSAQRGDSPSDGQPRVRRGVLIDPADEKHDE